MYHKYSLPDAECEVMEMLWKCGNEIRQTEYFHYYHSEKVVYRAVNGFALNSGYRHRLLAMGLCCFILLVSLFLKEFEYICEASCDEEVIKECGEEECYRYAVMLVKRSAT